MTTRHIAIRCPRCGKRSETVCGPGGLPSVNCGDCLMNDIEVVEMVADRPPLRAVGPQLTLWLLVGHQHYSENTAFYGYGDYPVQIPYAMAVVAAASYRGAQAVIRKRFPRLRFTGFDRPSLMPLVSERAVRYLRPADHRLSPGNKHLHRATIADAAQLTRLKATS